MTRAKDISKIITDADFSGTLDVTGAVTAGGLTVDTDTLYVDSTNNNIGIGTTSPTAFANYTTVAINGTTGSVIDLQHGGTINSRLVGESGGLLIDGVGSRFVKVHTNSTERMRIDSSGNVGIGTSSPNSQITLKQSAQNFAGGLRFIRSDNTNNFAFAIDGNTKLNIAYNDSTKLVIDSSGNVGIGTSSPASDGKLTIHGTDTDSGILLSRSSGNDVAIHNIGGAIAFRNGGESTTLGGLTERMRIDSSGEVTIQGDAKKLIFGASADSDMAHYADGQFAFRNTDAQGFVFYTGAGPTERFRIDADGHVTMPYQPAFLVHRNSNLSNFATGTDHTQSFVTESYDQNNDFSGTTFTAPVTGKYFLSVRVRFEDLDTAADYYILKITTSNRTYINIMNPDFTTDGDFHSQELTTLADMDASDTATVQVFQSGGTAQTDVIGDNSYTYFTGFLAC